MTSPTSSHSSSPESADRALAICGWSALTLLIAAVLTFGAGQHLGLFGKKDPLAAEIALHQRLNAVAKALGLSREADTRAGDLEQNTAQLDKLRREIAAILEEQPRSPRALYYQALERLAARDFPAARAAASRGLEVEPHNLPACLVLGVAYFQEKNYPEAEKAFRRALEIEPKALSTYDNLGQTLWLMDRKDEAMAIYRQRAEMEGLPLAQPAPESATPATKP